MILTSAQCIANAVKNNCFYNRSEIHTPNSGASFFPLNLMGVICHWSGATPVKSPTK